MPNRIIRSDLLDSERYHSVDLRARLAFFELLLCADDFGLLPVNPIFLRRHLTAFDGVDKKIIEQVLADLLDHDMIRIYESGGAKFAIIPRFRNIPRARKSRWPIPPDELGGNEIKELIEEMHSKRIARAEQMRANAGHVRAVYRIPITEDRIPITDYRLPLTHSEPKEVSEPPLGTRKAHARRKCPSDFAISESLVAWAKEKVPNVDIHAQTESFKDHTFKTPISDWAGAWRNWMRRTEENKRPATQPAKRIPAVEDFSKIDYGKGGLI